jgi:AraC-like DNA-binding protein
MKTSVICLRSDGSKEELIFDTFGKIHSCGAGRYSSAILKTKDFLISFRDFDFARGTQVFIEDNHTDPYMIAIQEGAALFCAPFKMVLAKRQFNFAWSSATAISFRIESVAPVSMVSIYFKPSFLSFFKDRFLSVAMFFSEIEKQRPVLLSRCPGFGGFEFLQLIDRIMKTGFTDGKLADALSSKLVMTGMEFISKNARQDHLSSPMNYAGEVILMEPDQEYSIKKLARELLMNPSKLKKDFKKHFDITVYSFLTRARMELARQMLLETNTPISEISASVGYFHPGNFTKAFKKQTGVAPTTFRRLSV